ncbi:nucleolar pre-ribosomal-associated protein 1 [Pelodytes ibericus]
MGKKRRSSAPMEPSDQEAKKPKAMEVEFTGTHFKSMLKEPQTALKGLEQFLNLSRKLPSPSLYDVVEGYIKISVECVEILTLLDGERRPESETMLIFQVLEAILLRTASDLSHLNIAGVNIVKKMLNTYMKIIYASVYSETHRMSRICLNLLSAIVTQGPECARDCFSHFDFNNKYLPALLKKRDKQGRPDVRMAYIQFALSFLISGDNATIIQVLELKDFVGEIFSTGIKEDRISTINLLLSLLKTKVVHNKAITKTQKVRFFTSALLNHLASLYRWNGIVDVATDGVKGTKDTHEAGKAMVRELVHDFLLNLCCSLKHGINFYDPSLATAGRPGNLVLLRFLVALKSATEDELVAELVVNILKVCPDLLSRYFKETQYSFVPRLKSAWLDNIKLLKKIYEQLPPISAAFRTTEFVPLPRLITMVMVTTVAPVCNKAFFTQGLNLPNKIVKYTLLSLVSSILKRAEKNIRHCLREDIWQKSEIYTPAVMSDFAQKYKEALSKLLPDINTIVATWQSLLKRESAETDVKKAGDAPSSEETHVTHTFQEIPGFTEAQHGSDDVQTTLLKSSLLQVLCLYQRVVPHLVAQSNFDFSKLLKGIVSENGIREEVPPVLQHQILQVALELPANKFSWFKFQDVPDVCGEKSVFYLLLKMFVACSKPQLKKSTRLLIIKVLRDSGVFEYTWKELDIWLLRLDKVEEDSKESVIQILERILIKLVSNPYPFADKAAEHVQEASILQTSSSKQDSDTVSIPISHIDDVLHMVDVIVEGSEGLDEEIGFALDEDLILQTFPFSAIVPVALEARNKLLLGGEEINDHVLQYFVSVLTDILHTQRDPLALCLMIQSKDKELASLDPGSSQYFLLGKFYKYYSLWIPAANRETLFAGSVEAAECPPPDESSYSAMLKMTFVNSGPSESHTEEMLKEAASQVTLLELPLAVKHTVLCLKSTVDNFSKFKKVSGANQVRLFLELLLDLLRRCETATTTSQQTTVELEKEEELFVDSDSISELQSQGDTIMEDVLTVIFNHPTLENWFLALERQSVPPHYLNPVSVKLLSSNLNHGVIQLLKYSARLLNEINKLGLVSKYCDAIVEGTLKELESVKKALNKTSPQLEALETLYPFMDTEPLNKIAHAILRLPEELLLVDQAPEKQLNCYGKILVQLLTEGRRRKQQLVHLTSSVEHVRGVGNLLLTSAAGEIETVLYEALQNEPSFAHVLGVDLLTHCLGEMRETCLSIAALLVRHSRTHLLQFELWCVKPGTEMHLKKNMGAYLPLVSEYLNCREDFKFTRPAKVSSAVMLALKEAFWGKLMKVCLSPGDSPAQVAVLSKLIKVADSEELKKLIEQLPDILAQSWSPEKWILAESISGVEAHAGAQLCSWKRTLLAACMKCLTGAYSANKEGEGPSQEAKTSMAAKIKDLMPSVTEDVPEEWNALLKMGLKYRYKDYLFLDILHAGIEQWYESEGPCTKGLVQLSVVHMMITQHSLFLPTLLRSREEENAPSEIRELLVDVLRTIVGKCPSVCDGNHFAVLLGAYGATLNSTDQKILLLLQSYERNYLSLTDFRLLLWGPAAVEHHKTRKSLGKSLWQQPSMEEILSLLDRDRMMKTILHFPLHRKLTPETGKETLFADRGIKDLDNLYDPCFLLPLFSELIRPELVVDCVKFVDVNALGLTIAALSSYDYNMRAAANYILGCFVSQMEGSRFRDKKQLQYLLDIVKNGIRQENGRLTFLLTLYVAQAAQQILKPEEHMYIKMSKFMLSHQYLDMKKVPDFYKLFYSFDLEHKVEREWILGLLTDGLRDKYCYELCDYQRIFHVILAFYNSPLCDETSQNQIIEILVNASHVTKAAYQLIRDHSLLTWILNILEKRYLENKLLANVISLVNNLWLTNLGNKENDLPIETPKDGIQVMPKLLPLQLVNEFLGVLMALLRHVRPNIDSTHLGQFFSSTSSVLRYRSVVLGAFKEMGRFAVNERMLSSKDALLLLHKWSTIEKDLKLQESLTSLAQEHKVKELLSTIKEKYKPQGTQQFRKKAGIEDQADIEDHQQPSVQISRDHIKSILIQWNPVLLNPSLVMTTDKCDSMDDSDRETRDTNDLVCATACLVTKWIFRAESEHALNTHQIHKSLLWFKNSILPHSAIIQELLKDCAWRSTIFMLYSKVCSDPQVEAATLGLLHTFNTVMVQLIETLDVGKAICHQAVKDLSLLPDNTPDDVKRAAGNFLVSLYIGDVWLGGKSTDMLRTHVKVVCEADDADVSRSKAKTPLRKKRKGSQEAIVALCKELSPAVVIS